MRRPKRHSFAGGYDYLTTPLLLCVTAPLVVWAALQNNFEQNAVCLPARFAFFPDAVAQLASSEEQQQQQQSVDAGWLRTAALLSALASGVVVLKVAVELVVSLRCFCAFAQCHRLNRFTWRSATPWHRLQRAHACVEQRKDGYGSNESRLPVPAFEIPTRNVVIAAHFLVCVGCWPCCLLNSLVLPRSCLALLFRWLHRSISGALARQVRRQSHASELKRLAQPKLSHLPAHFSFLVSWRRCWRSPALSLTSTWRPTRIFTCTCSGELSTKSVRSSSPECISGNDAPAVVRLGTFPAVRLPAIPCSGCHLGIVQHTQQQYLCAALVLGAAYVCVHRNGSSRTHTSAFRILACAAIRFDTGPRLLC